MSEITYRPATLVDAALAADLETAAYPDLPQDPVLMRYQWENPRQNLSSGRFIAENERRPVAYLSWRHGPWTTGQEWFCEVRVDLDRSALTAELTAELFSWICARAVAEGAEQLIAYAAEDEPEMLAVIERQGFARDRVDRLWELDLRANSQGLAEEAKRARDKAAGQGIEFVTLAAWPNPKKVELAYELDALTRRDIPRTAPMVEDTLEDFQRRANTPGRHDDRWWVALHEDRPVAMSYLFFPPVRGPVSTGYTCTHPEYRGRGLAHAIKLQTLAQAVDLGVPRVVADNDGENAPMLRINEKLGYRSRPGFVGHLKRVSKS